MDVMRTAVSMLGLYDSGLSDEDSGRARPTPCHQLIAQIGIIAAYFHRARQGLELPKVRKDLGEAAHFL